MSLIVWRGSSHQHIQTSRRRKYGSLGKTVLQDTLSADLVAEEYPKVSMANKAGDESDCCHHEPSLPDGVI